MTRRNRYGSSLGLLALFVTLAVVPAAAQQPSEDRDRELRSRLERDAGGEVRMGRHRETGKVQFIGTRAGQTIRRPAGVGPDDRPAAAARSFLSQYGELFGLSDPGTQLADVRTTVRRLGQGRAAGASVRFAQVHRGVPVFGGEITVQLDSANRILSVVGEVLPDPAVDTEPSVTADEAAGTAVALAAKVHAVDADELEVSAAPQLAIYAPALLGGPGARLSRLVWRTEVVSDTPVPMRELVLVDAQTGQVALHFDQLHRAKNREVCDNANNPSDDGNPPQECTAARAVRSEGEPATGVSEVDRAYDHTGHTYDFFSTRFGRDSVDGAGMTLLTTVRYCATSSPCPEPNAFWDGQQATYGDGYAADDVVAHELTHGVTEHEANLFYYYQSGAMNESFSDVFGELLDLTNGAGTDTTTVRWLVGEDVPGGAIRSMADPTAFGDPDRMQSPSYWSDPGDGGGVHSNSGVGNKAAYLLVDGGTFNGVTVSAIGIDKVAAIYYETLTTLLTSGSDYEVLYWTLPQACTNLVGAHGIATADCVEVTDAVTATEMHLQPVTGAAAPEAPVCPPGESPTALFADDLENETSGTWTMASPWTYVIGYATSGVLSAWAQNLNTTSDAALTMTADVSVPASDTTYLWFAHAYEFETGRWDGGVLEYSTNGGGTWTDAGPLFTDNGYTGTLQDSNPLGARAAFVERSHGYYSSRLDLSSLAGQAVRLRWRIATDSSIGALGWLVDDVQIHTCAAGNQAPTPVDDALTTTLNTAGDVDVLANDTDPDGDALTVASFTQGSNGTVSCTTAGVCTYTPNTGFLGADAFDYTADDGRGGQSTATVNVTVVDVGGGSVADFDGDGTTDRSVWRPSNGGWYVEEQTAVWWGRSTDVPVPGDYDGNNTTDRAVWRPDSGGWYVHGGGTTVFLGRSGDVPVPGDYDGNGTTDRAVWRPDSGGWYIEGQTTRFLGVSGDVPVPGDYDGDGDVEPAVWRPSNGGWYVDGQATVNWGLSTDVPVPGDYDGDGDVDRAVWRPSSGGWYVTGGSTVHWGLSSDVPVPGDYDGDGDVEPAVWRPGAGGGWHVHGGTTTTYFGRTGDVALPLPAAIQMQYFCPLRTTGC